MSGHETTLPCFSTIAILHGGGGKSVVTLPPSRKML
jgi:hypothetical protein